ncbi:hypothetical protein [Porphyromonas crevioricanis]|nr:hypothetical protein [Porphyromonas crevioricanis]
MAKHPPEDWIARLYTGQRVDEYAYQQLAYPTNGDSPNRNH